MRKVTYFGLRGVLYGAPIKNIKNYVKHGYKEIVIYVAFSVIMYICT